MREAPHRMFAASERLYGWLLVAYPKEHRREYGFAMAQIFRDQCRDAWHEDQNWGIAKLWLRILPDLAKTSVVEHLRRFNRSKSILDTNMKSPRNIGFVAIVVFIVSFFLPASSGDSGFACFGYCWDTLLGNGPFGNSRILSGGWFYYSGFAISNILFVGLVAALFVTRKISRLRSVISVVCFLHVLSWLVLNVVFGTASQIASTINIGYYVWLIAYGLLVAAHLRKGPAESPGAIPSARSVV